ncbi:uncharacterized protein LW94_9367 [Fusarium fujikuroi]|nr:uncharacterized protein LW94_9367 [Fusarium fujikuroi]
MDLPIARHRALKIPSELYEELTSWCNNPEIHHSATFTSLKWRELLLTQKFEEIHLRDTQERLDGVLRAFNCYQDDITINIARVNIKFASFIVESAPLETDSPASNAGNDGNSVCDSLPNRLAAALYKLSGIRHLTLDLEGLNEDQLKDLTNQMSIGRLVWPRLKVLKIRGTADVVKMIMSHCDPDALSGLHTYTWIDSDIFEKARSLTGLSRLHLYYDKANLSQPTTWACTEKQLWDGLARLTPKLNCLILRESEVKIEGQLWSLEHIFVLKTGIKNIIDGAQTLGLQYLALTMDIRRFAAPLIRAYMQIKVSHSNELEWDEVQAWYELIIKTIMQVAHLKEVWIFSQAGVVFKGGRPPRKESRPGQICTSVVKLDVAMEEDGFPFGITEDL